MAELWKVEWWTESYSGQVGNFNREYIEGDEHARTKLLDLVCQAESGTNGGGDWDRKRRFGSWLKRRSRDEDAPPERKMVRGPKAWRLVAGEWAAVEYVVEAPTLHVRWSEVAASPSDQLGGAT